MIENSLRGEIERGLLPPGMQLKQEALAERFGVSRQPVRAALERLRAAGLLERRTDRSLAVAGLTRQQAEELVAVRLILEESALRAALPRLQPVDLRRARRVAEEIADTADPARIEDLDIAFHRLLYAPGGNDRLLAMIDGLRRDGRRVYHRQPPGSASRRRLAADHDAILQAAERGDTDAAIAALAAHLRFLPEDVGSDTAIGTDPARKKEIPS